MKKFVFLFLVCGFVQFLKADGGPSDLVFINPYGNPGDDIIIDYSIEFYDLTGKKLTLEFTYDPITNKITIKGGTGIVIVSVTNKKTSEKKTSKVVFINAG